MELRFSKGIRQSTLFNCCDGRVLIVGGYGRNVHMIEVNWWPQPGRRMAGTLRGIRV